MDPIPPTPPPDVNPAIQETMDIMNERRMHAQMMNEAAQIAPDLPPELMEPTALPMEPTAFEQISETVVNGINAAVDQVREWF